MGWYKSSRLQRKLKSQKVRIPKILNRIPSRKIRLGKPLVTEGRGRFTDYYSVKVTVMDKEIENFIMRKTVRSLYVVRAHDRMGISQIINISTFH